MNNLDRFTDMLVEKYGMDEVEEIPPCKHTYKFLNTSLDYVCTTCNHIITLQERVCQDISKGRNKQRLGPGMVQIAPGK